MHGAGAGTGEQAAQAPQSPATQAPQSPNETVKGPEVDKVFVQKAMEANIAEMQMARLALEKSSDGQIRHFALGERRTTASSRMS